MLIEHQILMIIGQQVLCFFRPQPGLLAVKEEIPCICSKG